VVGAGGSFATPVTAVTEHDPLAFANSLSAKLAARSRHVCALLGAGAARACGLPDVAELEKNVAAKLTGAQAAAFTELLDGRNLEQALSRLRRIHALVGGGGQTIDGLTGDAAAVLDRAICREIVAELDLAVANLEPMLRFAAWIARADYHLPLEIFTVNYDLLTETALEKMRVPYFDGFVGAFRAPFRTDLVEAAPTDAESWLPSFLARLWKLHGSVSWEWEEKEVVRLGRAVEDTEAAAIYPSDTKYDESRRVPFVVLHDRLRRALNHPETLMIVSGYSWSDDHLNEVIFDAARHRPRSEIVAFAHSTIPDALVERAGTMPNVQAVTGDEAILGGIRGSWKANAAPPADVWAADKLALRDFRHLAAFLARSSPPLGELEARLADVLASAAKGASA
jgi:hypothetical protein